MIPVLTSLIAIAVLALLLWIQRRGLRAADSDLGWQLILTSVGIIAGTTLIATATDVLAAPQAGRASTAGNLVFSIGCVLACGPLYEGMVEWNRSRTAGKDPGESLNGLCSVLVLVAMANLVMPHLRDPPTGVAFWQLEASFWACGAVVVVFGTAASISTLGALLSDARIWLIITASIGFAVAQATSLIGGDDAGLATRMIWLIAAALIPFSMFLTPTAGPQHPAENQATIIGSLVVLLSGVGVLTVDNDLTVNGSQLATWYALAGVIGVSLRVLRLVQDLAHLAHARHEAMTDELTGVANRRALLLAIDDALSTTTSTSLLIIDLDRFKAINDRYGHAAGDLLLRHTADAFTAHIPPGGLLARLGGDEFAVLLIGVPADDAAAVARSLALAAAPLSDVKGRLLQVGASVGVATVTGRGFTGGELLRRADTAMYRAKISGSGTEVYDSALDAAAQQRLDLIDDLHLALEGPLDEREQIVVYFQPQLDLATGAVTGAEALVRWQHPRLGLLIPDQFIDLAEKNELMPGLTRRVMLEAAEQAGRWLAAGHQLRVSVNLSASCLSHPTLLPLIREVLEAGMTPRNLVLEVTETSLMTEPQQALRALRRIARSGVGISIDDYGTGYSSLSYLNDLPATELKIDRSFTSRAADDPRTAAIVGATVELGHRLGMRLVAEGIEDEATLSVMSRLGCDESQGYLHSRPLPAGLFRNWLDAQTPAQLQAADEDSLKTS